MKRTLILIFTFWIIGANALYATPIFKLTSGGDPISSITVSPGGSFSFDIYASTLDSNGNDLGQLTGFGFDYSLSVNPVEAFTIDYTVSDLFTDTSASSPVNAVTGLYRTDLLPQTVNEILLATFNVTIGASFKDGIFSLFDNPNSTENYYGLYFDDGSSTDFTGSLQITIIPEPGTFLLFGLGLIAFAKAMGSKAMGSNLDFKSDGVKP